jgi:hypothetical protein
MMLWPRFKFYDEGDPSDTTEIVEDPNTIEDNPDLDTQGDFDPRVSDDDKPVDDTGEDDDKLPELDDEKLLKVLETKGIKADKLSKIQAVLEDNPNLARKHQSLTKTMKAMRAKLEADGIDPDAFLGEAVSKWDGQETSKSKPTGDVPSTLQQYKPEQVKALGDAVTHFAKPMVEGMMPQIVDAVIRHMDFRNFAEGKDETVDSLSEKLQPIAEKHGITGRDPATLKLLHKLYEESIEESVEDLKGNEDDPHPKTKIGTPPPKGRDRKGSGAPEKTAGLSDEEWRKKHEKQYGKQ